jgi:hypothetical protein
MLLATVSRPYKGSSLLHTAVEAGVVRAAVSPHCILNSLVDKSEPSPHESPSVTVQNILDGLPESQLLHLACHGQQDRSNALDSGFLMKDGMLKVSQLMALDLRKAFLAFLSACETAKSDERQPDQVVHLAAAMLYAGFRSVVGTMWQVSVATFS